MYMVRLDIHCSNDPGILSADAANLLFEKRSNLTYENLLAVVRTPDKMVSQLVGDVFGGLRIHTPYYNMCSKFSLLPGWAALPLDES